MNSWDCFKVPWKLNHRFCLLGKIISEFRVLHVRKPVFQFKCLSNFKTKSFSRASLERDEVGSLPADKHEIFLQIDSIIVGVHTKACPKHPK